MTLEIILFSIIVALCVWALVWGIVTLLRSDGGAPYAPPEPWPDDEDRE